MRIRDREPLLTTIAILAAAFIAATVFAYYPFQLIVQPVQPPIYFDRGSNANQPDLGSGKTIDVELGASGSSAEVIIHPTYQITYYKNVIMIINTDNKVYNVYLVLNNVNNNLPPDSSVWLIVYSSGETRAIKLYPQPAPPDNAAVVKVIELNTLGTNTLEIGSLGAGSKWEIDFMVYIPEDTSITGASATFSMYIVYTPSGETPP